MNRNVSFSKCKYEKINFYESCQMIIREEEKTYTLNRFRNIINLLLGRSKLKENESKTTLNNEIILFHFPLDFCVGFCFFLFIAVTSGILSSHIRNVNIKLGNIITSHIACVCCVYFFRFIFFQLT